MFAIEGYLSSRDDKKKTGKGRYKRNDRLLVFHRASGRAKMASEDQGGL